MALCSLCVSTGTRDSGGQAQMTWTSEHLPAGEEGPAAGNSPLSFHQTGLRYMKESEKDHVLITRRAQGTHRSRTLLTGSGDELWCGDPSGPHRPETV